MHSLAGVDAHLVGKGRKGSSLMAGNDYWQQGNGNNYLSPNTKKH